MKDKIILPPIDHGITAAKTIPHSDRQTLVPNDNGDDQLRTFDHDQGRTSISAHDVTKTNAIDHIEEDPIAAQQRLDDLKAEKTLQTVVGMFGNQDHTASKLFIFEILFQVFDQNTFYLFS